MRTEPGNGSCSKTYYQSLSYSAMASVQGAVLEKGEDALVGSRQGMECTTLAQRVHF